MTFNDSHQHVVKTTAQWGERAVEYWVVPRGCLCVELTPEGKTKLKVGEGSKYFSQLPYICDHGDLSNYYTKEEIDTLFNNLNRMAIVSTDVYDSKDDLPLTDNKLGDVRFVKSDDEDPTIFIWNGTKWISTKSDTDLSDYVTKPEFNVVKDKVDEIYPKAHIHPNKDILDSITQADRDKFDSLHNYDDTEIRELIEETGHTHPNKALLDTITQSSLWSIADRVKFNDLHNYDDTEVRIDIIQLKHDSHTHTNKTVLDGITQEKLDEINYLAATYTIVRNDIRELQRKSHVHDNLNVLEATTAAYTIDQENELRRLSSIDVFLGAGPTWNGVFGYVPAPEAGQQTYYLRGDGTWAKVKSGGDKYKAGEGIYILSGETTSDSFPFKVYSRAGHLSQYIIYGNTGGVGDAMTGGVYGVNISITDEHGNTSNTSIILPEKISLGDYIDYGKQVFVHMRTDVSSLLGNIDPDYSSRWAIYPDGSIQPANLGSYGTAPQVTSLVELEPGATYELYHLCTYTDFEHYMNLNVYDTGQNRTRTINFYDPVGNVPTIIALASNEKYIRVTYGPLPQSYPYTLIRVKAVETPITLPQIPLFPNSINTINVTNTIKPAEIYVEVAEPSEDDPEDPMSDFTGIIYNDGVLDITQEDPNNLSELTIHFRDDVDKTITIPSTPLEPATTTTLGGIIVGNNLSIDQNGVLSATGGGVGNYEAGTGIRIISDQGSTVSDTLKIYANGTAQAIDYTIYGSSNNVGDGSNMYTPITSSSTHYVDWYRDSATLNGETIYYRNTAWSGLCNEIYLPVGTYTFSAYVKIQTPISQENQLPIWVILPNNEPWNYQHYNDRATVSARDGRIHATTSWERYSITFEVTVAGWVALRIEPYIDNNTVWISSYQLETGSEMTYYKKYNKYYIPLVTSAPNEPDITTYIEMNSRLGNGDSINYINDSLPPLPLYQNKVNTITVISEVTPSRLEIDARAEGAAEYSSIIENTGLLSVEQDPNDGHILTFDSILGDTTITIPSPVEMTGATDQTDGEEGYVPAPLAGDENKFLRGDGTWQNAGVEYTAGTGIIFESDQVQSITNPTRVYANNTTQAIDYTIDGSSNAVGDLVNLYTPITSSSVHYNDGWSLDSQTYMGQPVYKKQYAWQGLSNEIYLTEGIYTFSEYIKQDSGGTTQHNLSLLGATHETSAYHHLDQIATITILNEPGIFVPPSTWTRYSATFEVTVAGYVACRVERWTDSPGNYSYVTCYQLEKVAAASPFIPYGKYRILITTSAENENDVKTYITLDAPLGTGDSINYIDDDLPSLPLYQNKTNIISVDTTNPPSVIYIDARGGTTTATSITNSGLLGVTQDPLDPNTLTFETINGDIDVSIPEPVEMIGATDIADGTAGYVPTPEAGDENKFLRGDGTWVIPSSETYAAGDGIEIETDTVATYEDLHFDYYAFKDKIQGVINGSISFDIPNHALTISATNNYCYVIPDRESDGQLYKIPVEPNEDYLLTWEVDDTTVAGKVDVFENGDVTVGHYDPAGRESAANQQFLFTTSSTAETIHIRPYVHDTGTSLSFSNFQLYHVIYDTSGKIINAKIGNGLQFDANGAIEVISSTQYVRVNTTDSYVLLHTKPADWDDHWDKYFELTYDEITTSPPDWDPTQHYKYENDNYVLGTAGDTFVSTTWYDKHYVGLDPTTAVTFDSDVYYTGELHLIEDGETYDTAFEKVNEAIEHIERLEQEVQYLQDDRVGVRVTNPSSENLEFYNK